MASYSYCFKCSVLLREKDFAAGKAFRVGENVACASCATGLIPGGLPTPEKKPDTSKRNRGTSIRLKSVEARISEPPPPPAPARPKALLIAGASGILALIIVVAWILLPREKPPEPPPSSSGPAPAPPPVPAVVKLPPREQSARDALEAARRKAPGEQARALEQVAWTWEGTKASDEARQDLAALTAKIRVTVTAALAALDAELAESIGREAFGAALDRLDAAAKDHEAPEWNAGLASRRSDVESKASARLGELATKAVEHKARGETAEVNRIHARVEAWKLPRLLAALKERLEAVAVEPGTPPAPVEKAKSAEGKAWLEAWRAAASKATARDFAGAAADLKKAAAELREDEVKAEAAGDVEDFRALGALYGALLEAGAAVPVGKPLTLDTRSGRVAGTVVRNSRDRVELRGGKGPVFAEWGEVMAVGLAKLPRPRKPEEAKLLALLALLEGDVEGAKSLFEAPPAKALAYAAEAKGKIPPLPREEAEARALYYAAEREFASMETRGAAAEKYRTLRNDFATSSVARGELDRILRRSESGKEYLITAAEARISGTFKRIATGEAVSAKDSDAENANDNALDLEFYALPGTSYRAWLRLGGCCREVFSYFLQGTEMTASDKGKKISIEPGGDRAEFFPGSISSLRKEHKDHAKNKEPKGPARWEWVPLALPKYATPGLKKIRLMTYHQGFGFAQAVVSSVRTAAPKPAELEELLKAKAADVPPAVADPDLVLHWTFDEPAGAFDDLSGNGFTGDPAGAVKRAPGRLGGALELDGGGGHVAVKDAPELRLRGDLTVAFWMRKNAEASDWVRIVGKGGVSLRMYGVWEEPGEGKKLLWQIYKEGGGTVVNLNSTFDVVAGKWHHVACLRRGKLAVIYIDGRKDAQAEAEGAVVDTNDPFVAGLGHHAPYNGALDDLRIYRRGLTDEEVLSLFEAGR